MEFRILGPLEVWAAGEPLALGGAKPRAALAMLLLNAGRVVSTDRLIEALWGERPPATAVNALQAHVSQLRRALGDGRERLVARPPGYVLAVEPEQLDAGRFEHAYEEGRRALAAGEPERAVEQLRAALALWRGPALDDLGYQDFAQAEIARLHELRLNAQEAWLDAELELGRHDAAIAELERLIAQHPTRERLRGQLMLALYRARRQGDALDAYRDARRALVDELGIEPGPELRELERAILRQDPALATAPADAPEHHRIPAPPTPLIGRRRELEELADLLARDDVRLVTLTGPGGTGKTRLALELAHDALGDAVFVDLAPVRDPAALAPRIAEVLGVDEVPGERVVDTLARTLHERRMLLVLDNFEQLVEGAGDVAEILRGAPGLRVLATSRARLRLSGEHEYAVPPLARDDAVALFGERARAARPGFAVDPTVATICAFVDDLPLAIELAAARVRLLPTEGILARLGDRLALLTGGARDLPARQRALRDTIDWSYQLLDPAAQALLPRLALFVGGFDLDAVEDVCGAEIDVLEALASLLDNSLLRQIGLQTPRFGLLDTVRDYALERLEASGAGAQLRRRHAAHYLALAERAEPELIVGDQAAWLERLAVEIHNLRAALATLHADPDPDDELRLVGALRQYWSFRGPLREGDEASTAALGRGGGSPRARARALAAAAVLAWKQGDTARGRALAAAQLALWRQLEDPVGVGRAYNALGCIAVGEGDWAEARERFEQALAMARRALAELPPELTGHERAVVLRDVSIALHNLGETAESEDDYEAARPLYEESLEIDETLGDKEGLAAGLAALANLALVTGDAADAAPHLRRSLEIARELGHTEALLGCIDLTAVLAAMRDDRAMAARLLASNDAQRTLLHVTREPSLRRLVERARDGRPTEPPDGASLEALAELAAGALTD